MSHGDESYTTQVIKLIKGFSFSSRVLSSQHLRPRPRHVLELRLAVWVQGIHIAWASDGLGDIFFLLTCDSKPSKPLGSDGFSMKNRWCTNLGLYSSAAIENYFPKFAPSWNGGLSVRAICEGYL